MPFPQKILILIEGANDKDFFNKIIKPLLEEESGKTISLIIYKEKEKEQVRNYIRSFLEMESPCYLFHDFDQGPCYSGLRDELNESFPNLDRNKIIIVKKEIESWFLAGLPNNIKENFINSDDFNNTESVSKEDFEEFFPNTSISNIKSKILNDFNYEKAVESNCSFKYSLRKLGLSSVFE